MINNRTEAWKTDVNFLNISMEELTKRNKIWSYFHVSKLERAFFLKTALPFLRRLPLVSTILEWTFHGLLHAVMKAPN